MALVKFYAISVNGVFTVHVLHGSPRPAPGDAIHPQASVSCRRPRVSMMVRPKEAAEMFPFGLISTAGASPDATAAAADRAAAPYPFTEPLPLILEASGHPLEPRGQGFGQRRLLRPARRPAAGPEGRLEGDPDGVVDDAALPIPPGTVLLFLDDQGETDAHVEAAEGRQLFGSAARRRRRRKRANDHRPAAPRRPAGRERTRRPGTRRHRRAGCGSRSAPSRTRPPNRPRGRWRCPAGRPI